MTSFVKTWKCIISFLTLDLINFEELRTQKEPRTKKTKRMQSLQQDILFRKDTE